MKPGTFRFFRTIHSWGGIALTLWVLLASLSGALLVWKQEYLKLVIPEAREAFRPTPEALARIAGAVEAQFNVDEVFLIDFATMDFALTKVSMGDSHYAYLDTQGRIVTQWVLNDRWEEWLYDLHHRLLMGNTGLTIVGVAALAMIVFLLMGIVTFWPFRRAFPQGMFPTGMSRPQLLRSHRNLGLVIALPVLMTLATGAVFAFPEQSQKLLMEPFRGDNYSMDFAEQLDDVSGNGTGDWLPAMERALKTFPGSTIRSAQVPNYFSPYRILGLQQSSEWNPQGLSKIYIDAKGGQMDIRIDSQAQHVSERIVNAGYPLHTGRVGNLLYKSLLTASALLMAVLSLMGITSFIKSKL